MKRKTYAFVLLVVAVGLILSGCRKGSSDELEAHNKQQNGDGFMQATMIPATIMQPPCLIYSLVLMMQS